MKLTIQLGNNIDLLKQYPDNYFDSVVTDCPYGLGKEPNALKLLQDWIDHGYHEIKGKGFMGKSWDAFVPQPLFWKEVFRVLKPGGYVLAFFGTRTYDWGTLAIRLAGFEIRDMICWHYGSGFPKSLDISKQLDKNAGAERKVIGSKGLNKFNGTRADKNKGKLGLDNRTFAQADALTEPFTIEAKEWDGWGTALKPATEPICIARKPIEGTVAENVLKYGTGGINIDGCRIDYLNENDFNSATFGCKQDIRGGNYNSPNAKKTGEKNIIANSDGRFPANVIFDSFMANELDKQTGELTSGKMNQQIKGRINGNVYGNQYTRYVETIGDSGGASRFFYTAKASQFERNAGCDQLEQKLGGFKNESGRGISGNPDLTYSERYMGNHHPTVKPISLMSYLQRLVTPLGGKTLDPFAGSGTSGCSAYFENIGECVLMEMEESYLPIIEARTAYWSIEYNRRKYLEDLKEPEKQPENQLKLFGT
jgi:site-specific DNA-methyltransferase (adenine-specific)